jgi:hypothetical protein
MLPSSAPSVSIFEATTIAPAARAGEARPRMTAPAKRVAVQVFAIGCTGALVSAGLMARGVNGRRYCAGKPRPLSTPGSEPTKLL